MLHDVANCLGHTEGVTRVKLFALPRILLPDPRSWTSSHHHQNGLDSRNVLASVSLPVTSSAVILQEP